MPAVIALLVAVSLVLIAQAVAATVFPPDHQAGQTPLKESLRLRVVSLGEVLLRHLGDVLGRDGIEKRLIWAGEPVEVAEFVGSRLVAMALGAVLGALMGGGPLAVGGAVAGLVLPDMWLASEISKRQLRIREDLVQFVGLWRGAVEAGLDLMPAVERIIPEVKGPLSREFALAAHQVQVGRPLSVALYQVAERCGVPELTAVITALVQADRYGIGVIEPLRREEAHLLSQRANQARSKAAAVNVTLRMPMLLIMLGMIILLLGPVLLMFGDLV